MKTIDKSKLLPPKKTAPALSVVDDIEAAVKAIHGTGEKTRITIDLSPEQHRKLKKHVADIETSIRKFIMDYIDETCR